MSNVGLASYLEKHAASSSSVMTNPMDGSIATMTIPEDDDGSTINMDEQGGFQGDRIQVAVRLKPLQQSSCNNSDNADSVERSGIAPRSNPAACLPNSLLLSRRGFSNGSNTTTSTSDAGEGQTKAWNIQKNQSVDSGLSTTIVQRGPGRKTPNRNLFTLDAIFDETTGTQTIYNEIGRPIVQSVLSGRHGTIFAYGQTGSGKTFTMQGGSGSAQQGVTQMAIGDLFEAIKSMSPSRECEVKVQYFEVYNEEVRDLIAEPQERPESREERRSLSPMRLRRTSSPPPRPPQRSVSSSRTMVRNESLLSSNSSLLSSTASFRNGSVRGSVSPQRRSVTPSPRSRSVASLRDATGSQQQQRLDNVLLPVLRVSEDGNGNVWVNAHETVATTAEECIRILEYGNENRACAASDANQHSSRSHAIFRLTLSSRSRQENNITPASRRVSVLNLVDLAGSENGHATGSNAMRKREGGKINQSLLSLSRVIHALSVSDKKQQRRRQKQGSVATSTTASSTTTTHIGFRDSKLTRILQPSLSGNAAMAILACASMAKCDVEETRSTLKFASSAKRIAIRPTVNEFVDEEESSTKQALVAQLQKELVVVKQALREYQLRAATQPTTTSTAEQGTRATDTDTDGLSASSAGSSAGSTLEDEERHQSQALIVRQGTPHGTPQRNGHEQDQALIMSQPLVVGRVSISPPSSPPAAAAIARVDSSMDTTEETPTKAPPGHIGSVLGGDDHSRGSSDFPVSEVQILDISHDQNNLSKNESSSERMLVLSPSAQERQLAATAAERRANYLEERIENTESLLEKIYQELGKSRQYLLESSARNAELQEQVIQLQQDADETSEQRSQEAILSGWYFLLCIVLYSFGLRDLFISAVIFLWLTLQVSRGSTSSSHHHQNEHNQPNHHEYHNRVPSLDSLPAWVAPSPHRGDGEAALHS